MLQKLLLLNVGRFYAEPNRHLKGRTWVGCKDAASKDPGKSEENSQKKNAHEAIYKESCFSHCGRHK